jgi:superfamily II DNA or RNA helicase
VTFEARQYQDEDVDFGMNHGKDDRPIHVSPTGSGKTVLQAKTAKRELDRGNYTAILTPRGEIFDQTKGIAAEICGINNIGTLRAGKEWNQSKPIHVVSWPTLIARIKRSKAWFPDVQRVLVDECHLSTAPKMLEVLKHYAPRAIVDGYTATPARANGMGLGQYYTELHHVTSVRQLVKDGYLCPMEYWAGAAPDVKGIPIRRGDFEQKELGKRSVVLVGDVVDNWLRLASDRHSIVFAVDIAHAEALCDRFIRVGIKAAVIHSRMQQEDRDDIVLRFKAQEIQVLVNVGIATYGFDSPSVSCVVQARPTKSIVLHLQMLGRGMRPGLGKTCLVLDHGGNVRRLGQADDLFRWRLDQGKQACENWSRREESGERGETQTHECQDCHHLFSASRVCPKCGWSVPFSKRDVASTSENLVRISGQLVEPLPDGFPNHEFLYRMLKFYGAEKGYKPGWATAKFKDIAGAWPERDWTDLSGIPPTKRVVGHITKEARTYAIRRSYAERKTA